MHSAKIMKSEVPAPAMPLDQILTEQQREDQKKDAIRRFKAKAKPQLSSYEVAYTITVNALHRRIGYISGNNIDSPFDSGKQSDSDAGWAMDFVASEVQKVVRETLPQKEFESWLYRMDGVIRCAYASLTDKEMIYARQLAWMIKAIEVFGEMAELATRQGESFFEREGVTA